MLRRLSSYGSVHLRCWRKRTRHISCWWSIGVDILPPDAVRDLGVVLDSNLTMKKHVDGIVCSCFYQLRQLRSFRRSLTFDAAHVLYWYMHSFTVSRLLHAILHGVSDGVIRKLQSVLHAAARLVTGVRWRAYHAYPSWCAPPATSHAADHIQDCNDGVQLCSRYVPYVRPYVFLWRLYASSDTCRTCHAALCTPWSPHWSGYEIEDIWQS